MVRDLEQAAALVLDQQHREVRGDGADQFGDARALGRSEPGQRLVEQQHARPGRERHCHGEQALAAIAERAGFGPLDTRKSHHAQHFGGLGADLADGCRRAPGVEGEWRVRLNGEADVLLDAQGREQIADQERPADAAARQRIRGHARDRRAEQRHFAGVGREHSGEHVGRRGLAGAVRTDQRTQAAIADREVDALHRPDAAEIFGDASCREDHRTRLHGRLQERRKDDIAKWVGSQPQASARAICAAHSASTARESTLRRRKGTSR